MMLYYYKDEYGNFGDDLNPWLWKRLIPDLLDSDHNTLFIGIGTLLNNLVPRAPTKLVFGSGCGYGQGLPNVDESWKFYCVRGPSTAKALNLPLRYAITDPAALVATVYSIPRDDPLGPAFMPHHRSAWNLDWLAVCEKLGIRYIDPHGDIDSVLMEIARSSSIVTEAMHGAIVADCMRVPWMPVVFYNHILRSKWLDWTQSLDMDYKPVQLNGAYNVDYCFSKFNNCKFRIKRSLRTVGIAPSDWTPPPYKSKKSEIKRFVEKFLHVFENPRLMLSRDSIFDNCVVRLQERLDELKMDYMKH